MLNLREKKRFILEHFEQENERVNFRHHDSHSVIADLFQWEYFQLGAYHKLFWLHLITKQSKKQEKKTQKKINKNY